MNHLRASIAWVPILAGERKTTLNREYRCMFHKIPHKILLESS